MQISMLNVTFSTVLNFIDIPIFQSEIFPDKLHGGRMFYVQSVLRSEAHPSVAIVCGSCTAGGETST